MSEHYEQDPVNVALRAIAESQAQLKIVQVLAWLDPDTRTRVLGAVQYLIDADGLIPGTLDMFLKGSK
jgi:hypothetical protein